MNPSDAIEAIEKPLSSLPYSLSRHILEHLRKLTSHEPVPGIMGKSGAGKSSLCNALFQGEITPVSDVHAGTREVQRFRLSGHGHSMVTSSYQMLPGYFRFVCQNGCVCGQSLGEVRVPHRGDVVEKVIEGAYEVVGVFDRIPWVSIRRQNDEPFPDARSRQP